MFYVEMKAAPGRLRSPFNVYGKDWESPALDPCVFDTEEEAREFYKDCVEDERRTGAHCVGIRRAGESYHFLTWEP